MAGFQNEETAYTGNRAHAPNGRNCIDCTWRIPRSVVTCRHHNGDVIGEGFLDQFLDSIPILWDRGQVIVAICRRMGKQYDRFPLPLLGNDVVESGSKGEVDVCYVEGRFHDYEVRVFGDACVPTLDGVEVSLLYLEHGGSIIELENV